MTPLSHTMKKRLHPINILFKIVGLARNMVFPFIFLFIINMGSDSIFIKYGRIALLLLIACSVLGIILTWFTHRYEIEGRTLHIHQGIVFKTHRNVHLARIQNIQKHTSFLHRLFKLTSITLETGTSGDEASVKFDVISLNEATRMEQLIAGNFSTDTSEENPVDFMEGSEELRKIPEKTVHYTVSNKELVKASFTSLSFVAIIPLIFSIYMNIDDFFSLDDVTDSLLVFLLGKLWILIPLAFVALLVSAMIGLITTYLRYGKFEISSDLNHIHLKKGVLDVSSFSITKEKVQAIQFEQSLMKRWFGLVEVKLISAGSVGEEEHEINSLFPFLPMKQAFDLVKVLLPDYQVNPDMHRLPKKSLLMKLLRPSIIWILVSTALFYWKPEYWFVSPIWLAIVILLRYLDFLQTRYLIDDQILQIKEGSLTTTLFVTTRKKIQEIEVKQSALQRKFGLANIQLANRGKPIHISTVKDLPQYASNHFFHWFAARQHNSKELSNYPTSTPQLQRQKESKIIN